MPSGASTGIYEALSALTRLKIGLTAQVTPATDTAQTIGANNMVMVIEVRGL